MNEIEKEILELTKEIEKNPNDWQLYFNRANVYSHLGDYEEVIKDFDEVIKLDSKNKEAYFYRGLSHGVLKDYEKEIKDYDEVIKLDSTYKKAYNNRGVAKSELGKHKEAIKDFNKAIKIDNNLLEAYIGRGFSYGELGKYKEAIKNFNKAIKLDKLDSKIYFNRAFIYGEIEEYDKAIKDYNKIIELEGKNDSKKKKRNDGINTNTIFVELLKFKNLSEILKPIIKNENIDNREKVYLIKLMEVIMKFLSEFEISVNNKILFSHYTKTSLLKDILKKDSSSKFRLNNSIYMNDPEEGQIFKKLLKKENKNLEKIFESNNNDESYAYLSCFCKSNKRDELPMWVHYADKGNGVSFILNEKFYKNQKLYSVQYIDSDNFDINASKKEIIEKLKSIKNCKEVEELIENLENEEKIKENLKKIFKVLNNKVFMKNNNPIFVEFVNIFINYIAYLFKDKAYKYENEVRIIEFKLPNSDDIKLSEDTVPKLYLEINGINKENCDKIIVGPKANYEEISTYAKYIGIKKVARSKIKYK